MAAELAERPTRPAGGRLEGGRLGHDAPAAARTSLPAMQETPVPAPGVVAADGIRCAHCGRPIQAARDRRGLRRRFCCPAHREAARLRRERGLPENHPTEPNHHGRRRLGAGPLDTGTCGETPA